MILPLPHLLLFTREGVFRGVFSSSFASFELHYCHPPGLLQLVYFVQKYSIYSWVDDGGDYIGKTPRMISEYSVCVFFFLAEKVEASLFEEDIIDNFVSRCVGCLGVKMPLNQPLGPEVPHSAAMSCQPLLLYSLIVERSVSHPFRLTAAVLLVTLWCPLPTDAIVAAAAAEEKRAGPCRMWDNTGKEEEGIPEQCAGVGSDECLWQCSPVVALPPFPEDRL